jgi:hypothetical protein
MLARNLWNTDYTDASQHRFKRIFLSAKWDTVYGTQMTRMLRNTDLKGFFYLQSGTLFMEHR